MITTSEAQAKAAQDCWRLYGWGCTAPSIGISGADTSTNTKEYNEGQDSKGPEGPASSHSRAGVPTRSNGHFIGA